MIGQGAGNRRERNAYPPTLHDDTLIAGGSIAEFRDLTIHRHRSFRDPCLDLSAGAETRPRQEFLQTLSQELILKSQSPPPSCAIITLMAEGAKEIDKMFGTLNR
jgi:hypothetical protein